MFASLPYWFVPIMWLSVAKRSANMSHSLARGACAWAGFLLAAEIAPAQVNVVTGEDDLARTSANPTEIVLNTSLLQTPRQPCATRRSATWGYARIVTETRGFDQEKKLPQASAQAATFHEN